jgi:hypothetical protein
MLPLLLAAATVALVVVDKTPLRAASHDSSPRQTTLSAGDWLEVRGEGQGYVQVYDHRRERAGYVRPETVRAYTVDESAAPGLGAIVEYLRDAPGQESLGIGYAALFLRAAPAVTVTAAAFDAIGTMAERLGRRASSSVTRDTDAALAQVEVAESYGVHFERFEHDGQTRLCYDGEAFRRVLAMGATGPARARAALGLTDPGCMDGAAGATASLALVKWRAGVLDAVDPAALDASVSDRERARLRLRGASVRSALSYFAARSGDLALAKQASDAARRDLALVDRAVLADEDRPLYEEAALHAAAVRWAGEPAAPPASSSLAVDVVPGAPGQTCVRVTRLGPTPVQAIEHCTYALVWASSVRIAPHDAAVTLVTQPLPGWDELLVLHPAQGAWAADTVIPATVDPELGYVELAGFSPDGASLAVVREARVTRPLGSPHTTPRRTDRSFQVLSTVDQSVEQRSATLSGASAHFKRWETADWKRKTLALR